MNEVDEDPTRTDLPVRRFAGMHLISADAVEEIPIRDAVDALEAALRGGLDPEQDTPRSRVAIQAADQALGQRIREVHQMSPTRRTTLWVTGITQHHAGRGRPKRTPSGVCAACS